MIRKLTELDTNLVALSTVTLFELKFGVEYSQHFEKSNLALCEFCSSIPNIISFDGVAANYAAKIRSTLKRKGTPIGSYDLQIAGIALSQNLILVTNNQKEFVRVDGLKIENWV